MPTAAEVAINIRARDEASGVINRVKGSLGGIGGMAKTAAIGLGVATAGVGALAIAGFSFVKAAAEEEASVARLDQAIRNAGGAFEENIEWSKKTVAEGERLAFSDDQVRSGLALLVAQTGDYEEAQHRARVAMDLSRGANIDYETAAKLTGKITEENVQVLKRYGISLKAGATETEALAEIQKRFGGQAEEFGESAQGSWLRFQNQIDNVKEAIGAGLLPIFTRGSQIMADFLTRHQPDIERLSLLFGEKLAGALRSVVDFLIQHKGTITSFFDAFKEGLDTLRPVVEYILRNKIALIAAITAIGIAVAIAFGPEAAAVLAIVGFIALLGLLSQHTTELARWVDINNLDMVKSFEDRFGRIGVVVAGAMLAAKIIIVDQLTFIRDVFQLVGALLQGDWSAAWDNMKEIVFGRLETIKAIVRLGLAVLQGVFGDVLRAIGGVVLLNLGALVNMFGGLPDRIAAALARLPGVLFNAGRLAIQNLIEGLRSIPLPDLTPGFDLPGFGGVLHSGGIVPGPFGVPRLIMALAGEEVRTPAQQRTGGGAGVTNHIEIHVTADSEIGETQMRKLAQKVRDELDASLRLTGLQGMIVSPGMTP